MPRPSPRSTDPTRSFSHPTFLDESSLHVRRILFRSIYYSFYSSMQSHLPFCTCVQVHSLVLSPDTTIGVIFYLIGDVPPQRSSIFSPTNIFYRYLRGRGRRNSILHVRGRSWILVDVRISIKRYEIVSPFSRKTSRFRGIKIRLIMR